MIKLGQLIYAVPEVAWLSFRTRNLKAIALDFCSRPWISVPVHPIHATSSEGYQACWWIWDEVLAQLSPSLLKNATKYSVAWCDTNICHMGKMNIIGQERRRSQNRGEKRGRKGPYEQTHCSLLTPWQMKTASASTVLDGSLLFSLTNILWNDASGVLLVRLSIYTMITQ